MKTNKTKQINRNSGETLIATVDVSKNELTAYWRCTGGQETKPFKITNNYEGLSKFWHLLIAAANRHRVEEIIVGFESTGVYGGPVGNFMKSKPVKLVQINPMHTKKMKEITDNSPGKTDRKDPRVIADIIQLGHYLSLITPEGPAAELRELTHARESQMTHQTALTNRLEALMFKIFPEFVQSMNSLSTKTSRYLMEHYPTPEQLKEASLEELTREIRKISRGKLGKSTAQQLLEASEHSLGTKEGQSSILLEIGHILAQLDETERFVSVLEQKMADEPSKIPYHKNLLSIKGLGIVTVGGVIGEVADFRNYRTQSEIVKLAGLDLYEVSSGKHKGTRRISKRGRSLLRKLLYFASLNVVRRGGILHDYYQRLLGRGMRKPKALVAVSRKLLQIMFAIVRDGTEYIENHKPTSFVLEAVA